jgi:transcription elongation factor GreA
MDKYYLSKSRLDELKKELDNLRTVRRIEVSQKLKKAKEYGDLSENAEYSEAKDEEERVESRINELEDIIKKAVIIKKSSSNSVQIGSKITIKNKKTSKTSEFIIVGSNETNPKEGKISNESPIGKAVLGKKVGEVVEINTPAGKVLYQLIKIE